MFYDRSCLIEKPLQKQPCLFIMWSLLPLLQWKCFAKWENYSSLLAACFIHVNEDVMRTIYIISTNKYKGNVMQFNVKIWICSKDNRMVMTAICWPHGRECFMQSWMERRIVPWLKFSEFGKFQDIQEGLFLYVWKPACR